MKLGAALCLTRDGERAGNKDQYFNIALDNRRVDPFCASVPALLPTSRCRLNCFRLLPPVVLPGYRAARSRDANSARRLRQVTGELRSVITVAVALLSASIDDISGHRGS